MLQHFYSQTTDNNQALVRFSREQGSRFAKLLADDYNPLHDVDAKKFCVPGDLLFSVVVNHYGVSESMQFQFTGMVDESVTLRFPEPSNQMVFQDADKSYLEVNRQGKTVHNQALMDSLIRSYVAFSGTTFPHVIIPLMGQQNVMINPQRPMVMYESMAIELSDLDATDVNLSFAEPSFSYTGKRGRILLPFVLTSHGREIGRGEKRMLVSGIKAYDQATVDELIAFYNSRKAQLKPA